MKPFRRRRKMPDARLIAVGASAGGIEALRLLLPNLPVGFPAAVAIVLHRLPVEGDARLARVLGINAKLPVSRVSDADAIEPGRIYVSPPGVHLIVENDRFRLGAGPRENGTCPSIDVLFRSVAAAYGNRAAGVVLSGLLDDGTAGLAAIKAAGGFAVVQDPLEAVFGGMPRSAIENVAVDAIAPAAEIANALIEFVGSGAQANAADRPRPSPEDSPEEALSVALRTLVERGDLSERLAERSRSRGLHAAARRFERQAALARRRAESVRAALAAPTIDA
jgi:two-component system, chemotaxis family, protein-glutamate methylesterase/glutaminase